MIHTYNIQGMTCDSCVAKVKTALLSIGNINSVEISRKENSAIIDMEKHIPLVNLQKALDTKYTITNTSHNELAEQTKSWFQTYQPLILVFVYIIVSSVLIELNNINFSLMQFMQHFMAGFFLTFSFFKFLNLKGFADSYIQYDIIAKKFKVWPYIYASIELLLGLSFLINFEPFITNITTFIIMTLSLVGVVKAVINKKQIQCACLGTIFNLPMSKVTIIEDLIMILMSGISIYHFISLK